MVWQVPGSKNLMLDRRFRNIGRIARSSGTSDRSTYDQINAMLTHFYNTGKHSVLREIKEGIVTPIQVYGFFVNGTLDAVPSTLTIRPVQPTLDEWVEKHEVTPDTRKRYKGLIRKIDELAAADATLEDLPKILARYRGIALEEKKNRNFNQMRSVLQAFFAAEVGRDHRLWLDTKSVKPLPNVVKKKIFHLSVLSAHTTFKALEDDDRKIARALLFSGMNYKEYSGEWEVKSDRIVIHGTKAKGRDRIVPLIQPIERVDKHYDRFLDALKRANRDLSTYVFRRSYAHWLEEAGIPRIRRKMYMGHGSTDTTDLYEKTDVERFLEEDRETIRSWIFDQWKERHQEAVKLPTMINIL